MPFFDEIRIELIWLGISLVVLAGVIFIMFPQISGDDVFTRGYGYGTAPGYLGGLSLIGIVATSASIIYKWRNRL